MTYEVYTPPRAWRNDRPNGGVFAAVNRPISGRLIKKNYRADVSHFSSTLRGRRTGSRLRAF